jgi:hypothetical protein
MVYREREARQKAESDRDAAIKRAIEADADREHVREQFESVCSQLHDAQRDRDAALSAMWGMICCASELRESVRKFAYYDGGKETDNGLG